MFQHIPYHKALQLGINADFPSQRPMCVTPRRSHSTLPNISGLNYDSSRYSVRCRRSHSSLEALGVSAVHVLSSCSRRTPTLTSRREPPPPGPRTGRRRGRRALSFVCGARRDGDARAAPAVNYHIRCRSCIT